MNKNPLVSVFIPYYNDKAFVADAIEACLKQTYKNFECLLCCRLFKNEGTA